MPEAFEFVEAASIDEFANPLVLRGFPSPCGQNPSGSGIVCSWSSRLACRWPTWAICPAKDCLVAS